MVYDTLTTVIARSVSDEAIQGVIRGPGLLRGACHPTALRADRVARNDGINDSVIRKCRPERQRDKQEEMT
jgi:hypothetical protein